MWDQFKSITMISLISLTAGLIPSLSSAGQLVDSERDARLAHAHELLGNHYNHSVVRTGEKVEEVNQMIYRWTHDALPESYKKDYKTIAQTIIDESVKYEFDPIFVMSVIMNESTFRPTQIGSFGEIGLMQIRPNTAKWISKITNVTYKGKNSLKNPIENIKLGTAYLSYLRGKFDSHARLYLAAYNMGQTNVNEALERHIWPKDYAIHVMNHYISYYKLIREQTQVKIAEVRRSLAEVASDSDDTTTE
jgi:soluble lytic murein transglycosylase